MDCNLSDASRVRVWVRKGGGVPVSVVVGGGEENSRVWLTPEFCPEVLNEGRGGKEEKKGRKWRVEVVTMRDGMLDLQLPCLKKLVRLKGRRRWKRN